MHRLLPLAILGPLTFSVNPEFESDESGTEGLRARLADYLSRIERLGFSGVAFAVRDDEVLLEHASGFSHLGAGVPNRPETVFPLASITKHFTAAAVLRLEMDGLLAVEDQLERFFGGVPEAKRAITVAQLLSHSSGLAGAAGIVLEARTADEFVRSALATELLFRPGTGVAYSNVGYGLLAAIVERVAEQPFEAYLREKVFLPAGMEHTGFALPRWEAGSLAHGISDGRDMGTLVDEVGERMSFGRLGSGGFMTTGGDMVRWHRALNARAVLDQGALEKMATPRHAPRAPGGLAFGYGCGIEDTPLGKRLGHSGSDDVFSADFYHWLERDLFLFVAANDADMYSAGPLRDLSAILLGAQVPEPPRAIRLEPAVLAAYAGTWPLAAGEEAEVAVRGDALALLSGTPRVAALLHPVAPVQVQRRAALLARLPEAYRLAFEGDLEPLHELLDPFTPLDHFVEQEAARFDALTARHGAFRAARAVPAGNRFGEIAILAILEFERGTKHIEYSFGEREVGSIRFVDGFAERVVHPESPASFVAYRIEDHSAWRIGFRLGADGAPEELLLTDEAGKQHALRRAE